MPERPTEEGIRSWPGLRRRVIRLGALALLVAPAVGLTVSAAGFAAPAFRAVITGEKLNYAKRTARLSFKAAGSPAAGFRCELRGAAGQPTFADCRSPITYKHLQQAGYTFTVYAENASGELSMPASRSFTIRSNLAGTFHGRTSQTRAKFAAGVKIVVRGGLVQASSSISWAAHCTGQVGSLTDLTHFNGPVANGHFSDRRRLLQHLQGDTEDNTLSIHFTIGAKRAAGSFTDTSRVLKGSAVIAHCSTGTVSFTARP